MKHSDPVSSLILSRDGLVSRLSRRNALRLGAGGVSLALGGQARGGSAGTATPVARAGRVDIGGRSLFLDSQGAGSPTIVLEAGFGNGVNAWDLVQPALAQVTRVCSYDRAGIGRSDPPPHRPRAGVEIVDDLRALLKKADAPGPYVLVGHSLGGLYARLFAGLHPAEVAGLVLVDALPAEFFDHVQAILPPLLWLEVRGALAASPAEPNIDLIATSAETLAAPPPPPVPMIVLADGGPFPPASELPPGFPRAQFVQLWHDEQRALTKLAPGARLVEVANSGHDIPHDQPGVVIKAVKEVLAAARDPSTWATPTANASPAATPAP